MNNLVISKDAIPEMTQEMIDKVRQLENITIDMPQIDIQTEHTLHGGMYARTILIPAGTLLTGVLIKIPTTLIAYGEATVYMGDKVKDISGYNVIAASANRKQAFWAKTDTYLTMIFPTVSQTVEDAEHEFTDEFHLLLSHLHDESNKVVITGE